MTVRMVAFKIPVNFVLEFSLSSLFASILGITLKRGFFFKLLQLLPHAFIFFQKLDEFGVEKNVSHHVLHSLLLFLIYVFLTLILAESLLKVFEILKILFVYIKYLDYEIDVYYMIS